MIDPLGILPQVGTKKQNSNSNTNLDDIALLAQASQNSIFNDTHNILEDDISLQNFATNYNTSNINNNEQVEYTSNQNSNLNSSNELKNCLTNKQNESFLSKNTPYACAGIAASLPFLGKIQDLGLNKGTLKALKSTKLLFTAGIIGVAGYVIGKFINNIFKTKS